MNYHGKYAALAIGVATALALGVPSTAGAFMPASTAVVKAAPSEVTAVRTYRKQRSHRSYSHSYSYGYGYGEQPGYRAYAPYRGPYYGSSRGFEDPGFAYHGNVSSPCAMDEGYGRWSSCDW